MRRLAALAFALSLALGSAAGAGELDTPRAEEVSFGFVRAAAPVGASAAELYVGGHRLATARVRKGRAVFRLRHPPGRIDVRVRFLRGPDIVRRDAARNVWLLEPSARHARRERARGAALSSRLAALGRSFPGYAAFWIHDLRTGETASWNSDAPFPAASTVKLGVLVAALRRFGPRPERSSAWRQIRDLATWSSNLASNRLLVRLGGSEAAGARIAQAALHRLGATSSTFTGNYRLGTAVSRAAGDAPRPPPILAYRRTTAHDLGRILFELHAAAAGSRLSLRRTGLSSHEARVALALLLSSDPRGDNLGLLRPWIAAGVPMAQKQGWTTYLRHTAAVVYGARPTIVVVLTYRPGLRAADAMRLGRDVVGLIRG